MISQSKNIPTPFQPVRNQSRWTNLQWFSGKERKGLMPPAPQQTTYTFLSFLEIKKRPKPFRFKSSFYWVSKKQLIGKVATNRVVEPFVLSAEKRLVEPFQAFHVAQDDSETTSTAFMHHCLN